MPPRPRPEAGFTLIEVLVVVALIGLMAAIAVSGWSSLAAADAHEGTAQSVRSALRAAQQRAVTEGRAQCVWFDVGADTWTAYRGACDDPARTVLEGPIHTLSPDVRLADPVFDRDGSGTSPGVTFHARGTAWGGRVRITRSESTTSYDVVVERLTGHVSLR